MNHKNKIFHVVTKQSGSLSVMWSQLSITLILRIKASKNQDDIYQIKLNSITDVEKLDENFNSLQDLLEYIKEASNIQVRQETKTIKVIGRMQINKNNKVFEIAQIPLKYFGSEEHRSDQQIPDIIIAECCSENELTGEQIKALLHKIGIQLSNNMKQQGQTKKKIAEQQNKIKQMMDYMLEGHKLLQDRINKKFQENMRQIQNVRLKIEGIDRENNQSLDKLQRQIERIGLYLKQHQSLLIRQNNKEQSQININRDQLQQQIKTDFLKINKQMEDAKTQIHKDINILATRLEKLEKSTAKIQQNEQFVYKKIQMAGINVNQWVDPQCSHFKKVIMSCSKIISLDYSWIFGKNKLEGECYFSINIISLIGGGIALGIVDPRNKNKDIWCWNQYNISYFSHCICNISSTVHHKQGRGFKAGEKITVVVNLKFGWVEWRVGKQVRHRVLNNMIREIDSWVPLIYLDKNNEIEINQ